MRPKLLAAFGISLSAALICALLAVSITTAGLNPPGAIENAQFQTSTTQDNLSSALLKVDNLSCGGCIETIKKALIPLPGVAGVDVNLGAGTASVQFDADKLADPETIANAITQSGYPARLQKVLSPEMVRQEQAAANARSREFIAAVGKIEISRISFDTELNHARSRYESIYGADLFSGERGNQLLKRLKYQIAGRLVEEAIKMQEVDRTGIVVQPERLDAAMAELASSKGKTVNQLEKELESNGYPAAYFKKRLANQLRLEAYLEEHILSGLTDPSDRQQRYSDWLNNARLLTKVVYYDKSLETASLNSSCCQTGAAGSSCALTNTANR